MYTLITDVWLDSDINPVWILKEFKKCLWLQYYRSAINSNCEILEWRDWKNGQNMTNMYHIVKILYITKQTKE